MSHTDDKFKLSKEYRRGVTSLNVFSDIMREIKDNQDIKHVIDLSDYKFISPCFAVLLAAMPYVNERTAIRYNTKNNKCVSFLKTTGILDHYTTKKEFITINPKKNSIKFRAVNSQDECASSAQETVEEFPITLDKDLKDELISQVYEVFSNSFFHSKQNQAFCCGMFDSQGVFHFSIYDFGTGIPNNVREYLSDNRSDESALKWAWQSGHSTLNGKVDYPRGAGFQTLEAFVKENDGEIFLGSGHSYCRVGSQIKRFGHLDADLPGTFFSISIKKDFQHRYKEDENKHIIKEDV